MSHPPLPFDFSAAKEEVARARQALGEARIGPADYLAVVDGIVSLLGRAAGWDAPGHAMVALGGYGRGELSPRSDIDLLFLCGRGAAPRQSVEAVLYPLWDLGFDVGHGLRTPRECARLAEEDLTAATALLDGRLLQGDASLLEEAKRRAGIRPGGSREMRRWVGRILTDVEVRRARFGEVSHLLEPHIKEGKGGLRDFQAAQWIQACLGHAPGSSPSHSEGASGARAGYDFLTRARNALHAVAGRKTDHLTFDLHRGVSECLFPGAPVAEFFEALYRASHAVLAAWEELAPVARDAVGPRLFPRPRPNSPPPSEGLAQTLENWSRSGAPMPGPLRQAVIRGDTGAVAGALVDTVSRVLHSRVPLAPLLLEIHRLGRLALVAPEVEAVAHQVHYDARHAFTTGVHCIETLAVFEDLWLGLLEKEEPHLTRIAGAVVRPHVARLAALCHDLGKGRVEDAEGGHAEAGAGPAKILARRLGFSDEETEAVAALVRRHRAVPSIAFGRDLESPASWAHARRAAAAPAALEELVVLAYADLKATNPKGWSGVWSDWKRDLLLTLYARASVGADRPQVHAPRDPRVPPREAAQVPPDLLDRLLGLARTLGSRPAEWQVDPHPGGVTEILGVAHASPRLLSSVTGALAGLRFDILSFQAHTWADGCVHLWIRAACPKGAPAAEEVARQLTGSLTGEMAPFRPRRSVLQDPRADAIPVERKIRLRDGDDPYHSVLEVRCRDRQGLIRDLTRVFEHHGLTVTYALVTTVGPMAQDVFHLRDIFGGRIEGETKVRALLDAVAAASEVARPPESEHTRNPPPGQATAASPAKEEGSP